MATTSFSEMLLRRAESYEAENRQNKELIDEWIQAVNNLFAELRVWLQASDPSHILEIKERETEVKEPNVGRYDIPRLDIRAFGIWVGIIPKARKTVKTAAPAQSRAPVQATGRVDITDELRRYVLYRMPIEDRESWFIESSSGDLALLTKENFEEALMSYFQ